MPIAYYGQNYIEERGRKKKKTYCISRKCIYLLEERLGFRGSRLIINHSHSKNKIFFYFLFLKSSTSIQRHFLLYTMYADRQSPRRIQPEKLCPKFKGRVMQMSNNQTIFSSQEQIAPCFNCSKNKV